jgi:NAD(P)-dependent dehydrogenase (short-subunit alcohol dehydrogenase family)
VLVNDYGVSPEGNDPSPFPAQEVVSEIEKEGGSAIGDLTNVSESDGGKSIIEHAIDVFGKIDILVNNAGIVRDSMIYKMAEKDWDMVIKVHLYGTFHCTRYAAEIMRKQKGGRIINMSSTAGLGRTIGTANYAAAKEGIVGFTRAVARDMMAYNVTCNAIRPLAVTRHFDQRRRAAWLKMGRERLIREMESSLPEDVAVFVVFLSSEKSGYITGRTFQIAGRKISLYSEPSETRTFYSDLGWSLQGLCEFMPRLFEVEPTRKKDGEDGEENE